MHGNMGSFYGPIKFVPCLRKSQARKTITGMLAQCLLVYRLLFFLESRYLQTVSRYVSRDKYRDASMHR